MEENDIRAVRKGLDFKPASGVPREGLFNMAIELYKTKKGKFLVGDSFFVLKDLLKKGYRNKVQLIMTSPPFPLNDKKKYGNLQGEAYNRWLAEFAPLFSDLLKKNGSIVIELGNSWEPGRPTQALLTLESLLSFVKHPTAGLRLCQEFICYNPSRLPSPAQWVTIKRIRTTDSYTHVWWMSKDDFPKADNRKVLRPYSQSMKELLKRKSYNSGKRPSEHVIGEKSFLSNNRGSIMPNLLEIERIDSERDPRLPPNVLSMSNTNSNDAFMLACRRKGLTPHPARMQQGLVNFFIEFLTDPGDLVLDPFGGSNTTGFCAEKLGRRWIAVDIDGQYGRQSKLRFK